MVVRMLLSKLVILIFVLILTKATFATAAHNNQTAHNQTAQSHDQTEDICLGLASSNLGFTPCCQQVATGFMFQTPINSSVFNHTASGFHQNVTACMMPTQDQQALTAAQLVDVLEPTLERAVSQAQTRTRLAGLADRLARLEAALESAADSKLVVKLQAQLEMLMKEVSELRHVVFSKGQAKPKPKPKPHVKHSKQDHACERDPHPLPGPAPYEEPTHRACARSCLQLRDQGGSPQDGVYWFTGMPVPTLCDFSHDGGGWTLLVTATSNKGWDAYSLVEGRNVRAPSLSDNYSILRHGNGIRNLGKGGRFAFRIETEANKARRHCGGIWWAPRKHSLIAEKPDETNVALARIFVPFDYKEKGPVNIVPFINTGVIPSWRPVLSMMRPGNRTTWWGTLIAHEAGPKPYAKGPWIHEICKDAATMLYWMREEWL